MPAHFNSFVLLSSFLASIKRHLGTTFLSSQLPRQLFAKDHCLYSNQDSRCQKKHSTPIAALQFFPQLPPELRRIIWQFCILDIPRRVVEFNVQTTQPTINNIARPVRGRTHATLPALLAACRESSEVSLKHYIQCFKCEQVTAGADNGGSGALQDPERDRPIQTRFNLGRDYMWLSESSRGLFHPITKHHIHVSQILDDTLYHSRTRVFGHELPHMDRHTFSP